CRSVIVPSLMTDRPASLQEAPAAAAAPASRGEGGHIVFAPLRLTLVGLGISVVPLDTAVNIAFPDITGSFGLPIPMIQWVVICYVLTHAGLMLAFGRIGDMWGHARVFRAGLAWSVAAFLLCAAAPSFGWLLFFRFLQGISAGLIVSCAPALVTGLYPEARRSHALGMFTLIYALGSAVGPLLGGVLVARWGWPAVFWFRAPIALASLMFLRGLPSARGAGAEQRFDTPGALLLAVGLATLLLGINSLSRLAGGDYRALPLFAVALVSLALFVHWERRAAQPIVRIELFRRPGFALINIASGVMYLMTFSVMLIAPFFFPRYTHLTLREVGLVLGTGFIAMAAASPLAGRLVRHLPAARVGAGGALLAGAGLFLVGSWGPATSPPLMAAALALQGFGTGFFQVSYMEVVMAASPLAHRGVAGSLSMLTRTIGVVLGAALLTLGFQAIQSAAQAAGDPAAFLTAFHAIFRMAGVAAALTGVLVAWSARRAAAGNAGDGL
ncbi:MAG TPA: MFS transporter, partial [Stellaceae bacterium]|nr:MFS transporter [Stellaceae bacterium]